MTVDFKAIEGTCQNRVVEFIQHHCFQFVAAAPKCALKLRVSHQYPIVFNDHGPAALADS